MMSYRLARLAYEAYSKSTGNKNHLGNEMQSWDDLPQEIQDAWDAAAGAVFDATRSV
jgi:hypothetical protein